MGLSIIDKNNLDYRPPSLIPRCAMGRRIPRTKLWSLMDSLSAVRYALERTTLCGTWK